jgi:adenylylsulfate kinase
MVQAMAEQRSPNVHWHMGQVSRPQREAARGHRGAAIWLTGLSGSGKSTIAVALERVLVERGVSAYVLDGDNLRHGLCSDLGFSHADRTENIRRIGEVAKLFVDAGLIVLCAFVSPFREDRDWVRKRMATGDFIEVHVLASLDACRARDPKGLYQKATQGQIAEFTGLSSPYEPPLQPELTLDTEHSTLEQNVGALLAFLEEHGYLAARAGQPG